jgi:aminopeptidase
VQVVKLGGHPVTNVAIPGLNELFFENANDEQLQFVNPVLKLFLEEADVILDMEAPTNTRALTGVPPEKMALMQQAVGPLQLKLIERISDGSLRWCYMPYPTGAAAQQTEMGIHAYTEFLYKACGLHHDDPIAYWESVRDEQTRLADYLADKSHAVVKGPGIDLSFDFGGRAWISCHGNLNFPDGEIFTGPIEDSVNGTVDFNMRTIMFGNEVKGVKLRYENGVIVDASAESGEAFLMSQLDLDEGARRMGEFAIGTNWGVDRITGSTLLDEKIGGTIHMAIGASLPDSGGVNQSKVHWDMVHDMKAGGQIFIDGELFYENGHFKI